MNKAKRKKLETKGWKFGSAQEFLDLTPEEAEIVEMRLNLANTFKAIRKRKKLSQTKVATIIQSSQSRIAKLEAGDPSVSLDHYMKSLIALGASRKDIAKAIAIK